MTGVAEVRLWGRTIGAVSQAEVGVAAQFEYVRDFAASGIQVAPLMMPLSHRLYRFPELAPQTFNGLPGLLEDSLPDRFGNALIDLWLARRILEQVCDTVSNWSQYAERAALLTFIIAAIARTHRLDW